MNLLRNTNELVKYFQNASIASTVTHNIILCTIFQYSHWLRAYSGYAYFRTDKINLVYPSSLNFELDKYDIYLADNADLGLSNSE